MLDVKKVIAGLPQSVTLRGRVVEAERSVVIVPNGAGWHVAVDVLDPAAVVVRAGPGFTETLSDMDEDDLEDLYEIVEAIAAGDCEVVLALDTHGRWVRTGQHIWYARGYRTGGDLDLVPQVTLRATPWT